jgi:hypothetical protein
VTVTKVRDKGASTTAAQAVLLEELKEIARQLGFEVRQEKLLREVGYHVRSGSCRVREANIILLDRTLPVNAQIDVLVDELSGSRLDNVYLSPQARKLLEGAAA